MSATGSFSLVSVCIQQFSAAVLHDALVDNDPDQYM